jgi:two-component system sensor kinase FixL
MLHAHAVAALNAVDQPILIVDRKGRIQTSNRAYSQSRSAITGAAHRASNTPEIDCPTCAKRVAGVLETLPDEAPSVTWQCDCAGNSTDLVHWTAKPLVSQDEEASGVICIGRVAEADIADQLRASEEEHRVVLTNISDAVFITDDEDMFTFVCPNVDVIFGYSVAEVQAMERIEALLGPAFFDVNDLHTRGEILNIERVIQDKGGRPHVLLINVKKVDIRDGTRLFTCRDISERKQAAALAQERQRELEHATRLSLLGEMMAGLAHELNQPLSAISNFAQTCVRLIEDDHPLRARLTPHLDQISDQALRTAEIIRRMRFFARKRAPRTSSIDLAAALRAALEITQSANMDPNLVLEDEVPADLPRVRGDSISVQQVTLNLLRNACEAVSVANRRPGRVTLIAERDADRIRVAVRDNGPGIPADESDHLFEPFFSTKENGLGLGLAISRSIIEQLDGALWIGRDNTPGCTVYFDLPLAD